MGIKAKRSRVVAVIPAKMTSQRFPRKNVADLNGRPLIYYSIRVALLCEMIDTVYVSSEDSSVLELAEEYGAESIQRSAELSEPHVTTEAVLRDALGIIESRTDCKPELIVLLQPTHPLRQPSDIDQAIYAMLNDPDSDSLFSLVNTDELRGEIRYGKFIPEYLLPRDKNKEPKMYRNCGSFYIFRTDRTLKRESFFGERILPFILERTEFEVDIDYPSDLRLAACLLRAHSQQFSHFKIA